MAISVTINGEQRDLNVDPDTPLLWVIRDHLQLTGTKFGCGIAQCGACTVHMNGTPIRSCSMPVSAVAGQQITTIGPSAVQKPTLYKPRGKSSPFTSAATANLAS